MFETPANMMFGRWINSVMLLLILVQGSMSIKWLGLHRYPRMKSLERERFAPNECIFAQYRYGLQRKQLDFCHHPQGSFAMHAVLKSAQAVAYYCPQIFQDRRWNCSSVQQLPRGTPDINRSTRERAAMHALSGAALMFEIARRCAENKIYDCECGVDTWSAPPQGHRGEDDRAPANEPQTPSVPAQYHWGGCSDNIQSARVYAQAFLNFPEERPRKIGYRSYRTHRQMARYVSVEHGDLLIAREFDYGSYAPRVIHYGELAFTEHSPDYCEADPALGSTGTHGRACTTDETAIRQSNHCRDMCCGRGHVTFNETMKRNCNCRMTKNFTVICDKCSQTTSRSVCK